MINYQLLQYTSYRKVDMHKQNQLSMNRKIDIICYLTYFLINSWSKFCEEITLIYFVKSNYTSDINTFHTSESQNHDIKYLTLQKMNK